MGWNYYNTAVPGSGRAGLAAVSMTAITRRLQPPHRARPIAEFRLELFEPHRRCRPSDALRQMPPARATRRDLAEQPPAYATRRGRVP
jgi:hypothetical protein